MLWSLAPIAENLQEIADRQAAIRQLGSTQVAQYQTATAAENVAGTAADDAATKRAAADTAAQTAKTLGLEVKAKAQEAALAMQGQMADLAGASALSNQLQNGRNAAAFAKWQSYLTELAGAKVTARRPPA